MFFSHFYVEFLVNHSMGSLQEYLSFFHFFVSKKQKAHFERTSLSSIRGCHCTLSQHGKGVRVDVNTCACFKMRPAALLGIFSTTKKQNHLSLSLSLSLFVCLSVFQSFCLSVRLSFSLSLCVSPSPPSLSPSLCLCLCLSLSNFSKPDLISIQTFTQSPGFRDENCPCVC